MEIDKVKLKEYFNWYRNQMPERIGHLESFVNESEGFENWRADCSPESLMALGEWYANQISTVKSEVVDFQKGHYSYNLVRRVFSDKTYSLIHDLSMYLSCVFFKNYPQLVLKQELGSKNSIDYGYPVISGFGKVNFNPVRMLDTLTYRLLDHPTDTTRLFGLYEIWRNDIPTNQK